MSILNNSALSLFHRVISRIAIGYFVTDWIECDRGIERIATYSLQPPLFENNEMVLKNFFRLSIVAKIISRILNRQLHHTFRR